MKPQIRHRLHVSILSAAAAVIGIASQCPRADRSWANAGSPPNRWNVPANWSSQIPAAGDRAIINAGGGGTIQLATNGAYTANVGTIQIDRGNWFNGNTDGYYTLNASNSGSNTSTLAFSSSATGGIDIQQFRAGTFETGTGFFIGAGRFSTGTLLAPTSRELVIRTAQNQGLGLYATLSGTGSITLQTIATGQGTLVLGDLLLGYGRGAGEGTNVFSAANTFSGGVRVQKARLNLTEDSIFSGATMLNSPAGLGTITFEAGSGTITANAALTGFDDRTSNLGSNPTRIIGNTIQFNADVDVTGAWAIDARGPVTFDQGSARTLNTFPSGTGGTVKLGGTVTLGSGKSAFTLTKGGAGTLLFNDVPINTTSTDANMVVSAGTAQFGVGTGSTRTFAGAINSGTSSSLTGNVLKTGAGTFEAKHVRNSTFTINQGVAIITATSGGSGTLDVVGDNAGVSRTGSLTIASGAALDLKNNDLVVDYTSTSPIGNAGTSSSGIAGLIKTGFASGSWNGAGIRSSTAAGGATSLYALGYGEASNVLDVSSGTATFGGQVVDSTTVVVGFTYAGDADINGKVDLDDFTR